MNSIIVMNTNPGFWGKGKTVAEAIKNAQWIEAGDAVRVIRCDDDAYIDDFGALQYTEREIIGVGNVKRGRKSVHFAV